MSVGCFAAVGLQKSQVDLGLQPRPTHKVKLYGMDIHAGGKGMGCMCKGHREKTVYAETSACFFRIIFV